MPSFPTLATQLLEGGRPYVIFPKHSHRIVVNTGGVWPSHTLISTASWNIQLRQHCTSFTHKIKLHSLADVTYIQTPRNIAHNHQPRRNACVKLIVFEYLKLHFPN